MCTQHVKYFRKALIQKTFADNFSFQPYPTAKIRLRLHSRGTEFVKLACTQQDCQLPAPCTGTQPSPSKGGLAFVLRHTHGSVKDMAFQSRHAKQLQSTGPAQDRHQPGAAWHSSVDDSKPRALHGKPGDAL